MGIPLGVRCSRCERFFLRGSQARRGLNGQWRHESCEAEPAPDRSQLEELAGVLMRTQPWPRSRALSSKLEEIDAELAWRAVEAVSQIPSQPTGTHDALPPDREREQQLLAQRKHLREALDEELSWKARRLAFEWADGH